MNNANMEMTWEMLADALSGIRGFYDQFETVAVTAKVDKGWGYMGDLEVGITVRGVGDANGNGTATA